MEQKAVKIQKYPIEIEERCPQLIVPTPEECYVEGGIRNRWMNKLIMQYREIHQDFGAWSKDKPFSDGDPSPSRFIQMICLYLEQSEQVLCAICSPCIDIRTATGECLCILGNLAGFPCQHCGVLSESVACDIQCVFDCDGNQLLRKVYQSDSRPVDFEFDTTTPEGEEAYRRFLAAWHIKRVSRGLGDDVIKSAQALWPDDSPQIVFQGGGNVFLEIGRAFSEEELALIELYKKVLPIPRGVTLFLTECL